jgi:hypothetical protein
LASDFNPARLSPGECAGSVGHLFKPFLQIDAADCSVR